MIPSRHGHPNTSLSFSLESLLQSYHSFDLQIHDSFFLSLLLLLRRFGLCKQHVLDCQLRDAAQKSLLAASDGVLRFLDLLREELVGGVQQKQRGRPLERTRI